jgi:membrane protease YdiL (CAAX protease family)
MDNFYGGFGFNFAPDPFNFDRESTKKRISRLGLAISIYLIVGIALVVLSQAVILLAFDIETANKILLSDFYIWGSQILAMYIIAFPILYLIARRVPRKIRQKRKMGAEELFMLFFIAQVVSIAGSFISSIISTFFSIILRREVSSGVNELIMDTPVWIVVLVAVVIGPIFEELIFRHIFFDRLSPYGEKFAIVTTAIAFGLFHGNFDQLVYAIGIGIILGYIYSVTRDVRYSIGFHIVFNFFGTVPAMLVSDSLNKILSLPEEVLANPEALMQYSSDVMAFYGYSIVQLAFVGLGIYFLVKAIKQKRFKLVSEVDVRIPRSEISRVFVNPGVITFAAVSLAQFILNLF